MKITLKIDPTGTPYIELFANDYNDDTLQDLLKLFIVLAKNNGIFIKNEDCSDHVNSYASIRIKKQEIK